MKKNYYKRFAGAVDKQVAGGIIVNRSIYKSTYGDIDYLVMEDANPDEEFNFLMEHTDSLSCRPAELIAFCRMIVKIADEVKK